MNRNELKTLQPIVYQTLHNALMNDSLSHCYLFVGPTGTARFETAILLAQSLVCDNTDDGWACQQCIQCIRIEENNYADYILIDGSRESIKAEQILNLQYQFSQTALEKAGRKIFIINNCENMTLKAANSLLKFIEEPSNNLTGIFITTSLDNVLPTIASRCQIINFHPLSKEVYYNKAMEAGLDELNAHIVSQLINSPEEIEILKNSESYQNALFRFTEFMFEFLKDRKNGMIYLQEYGFRDAVKDSDRRRDRDTIGYFLDIAEIFVNDYFSGHVTDDESWTALLNMAKEKNFDFTAFLQTVSLARDGLRRSANVGLLTDQMLYRMMGGAS